MNLIIDVGNTRVKVAVFEQDTIIVQAVFDKEEIVFEVKKIIFFISETIFALLKTNISMMLPFSKTADLTRVFPTSIIKSIYNLLIKCKFTIDFSKQMFCLN